MGAPTSNRKRGSGYFSNSRYYSSPSPSLDSRDYFSSSKKPKLSPSPMHLDSPKRPPSSFLLQTQSIFSRVKQYPDLKPLEREVHAPCRGYFKPSTMGNTFRRLQEAKHAAFGTFRYVKKDNEVIHLEEEFPKKDDFSEVEEVQVLNDKSQMVVQSVDNEKAVDHSIDDLKEKYKYFADNQRQGSSSGISDLIDQTPRAYDGGKMVGFTREIEKPSEPPHRRLYEESEKRNPKLSDLAFWISLVEKKLPGFPTVEKKSEKDLLSELFVELTDEEDKEVTQALSVSNRRKLLATHTESNIEITGQVLQCLRPGAWLNDEVINLYLELLKEREKREPQKFLKCHFFSTFFYKKLISGKGGYDFKAVRRWTTQRKIGYGLVECDKIFVPIHKEIHWCLAIINKKDQKFQYLDSLKGRDSKVLDILTRYYVDEVKDKSAKDIDVSSWKQEYVDDLPEQENGFDCGMFMIKYADFYSRGLGLRFSQENMPYFRRRTVKEILKLKAE